MSQNSDLPIFQRNAQYEIDARNNVFDSYNHMSKSEVEILNNNESWKIPTGPTSAHPIGR